MKKEILKGIIISISFSLTTLITFLAYGAFVNMTEVTSSDTLTATGWNNIISNINDLNNRVNNQPNIPTGAVMAFNGTSCPDGWNVADGSGDEKNTSGINTTLDLRGEFIRGWIKDRAGFETGRDFGSFQEQDWKGFYQTNTLKGSNAYTHDNVYMGKSTTSYIGNLFIGYRQSPGTGMGTKWDTSEVRPRNVALLYCVKN